MRSRMIAVAGSVAILASLLTACSKTTDSTGVNKATIATQVGGVDNNPKDSLGPAAPIAGAVPGGTIDLVRSDDSYLHLDPARTYNFYGLAIQQLIARPLTEWKQSANGTVTLVGDTATTPGIDVNKDCKTWKFPIKSGLKFSDGTPITANDIAYGIARSFDANIAGGPSYIQSWLVGTQQYETAWNFAKNKTSLPPGLTVPDPQTLLMTFPQAHCDLPFAASLPETAPVPAGSVTNETKIDNTPVTSGPYMVASYTKGSELDLVKNPNWDPASDAVRHQYADKFVLKIGPDIEAQTNRNIVDSPADQTMIGLDSVATDLYPKVLADPTLRTRMIDTSTPDLQVLDINNERVTDLSIRQALNYAIDRQDYLKSLGGSNSGTAVTTLMPPQVQGYKAYDAYPAGPTGNIAKAQQLLAGRHPTLVLALDASGTIDASTTELKTNLEKAGFKIVIRQVSSLFDAKEADKNAWDLYLSDWAFDWPSGSSALQPLYDGRTIQKTGNLDTAYLNAPDVNAEIARIEMLPAAQETAPWMALDKMIMTKYAPVVPLYLSQAFYLYGSKLGGIFESSILGYPDFVNAYVKQ